MSADSQTTLLTVERTVPAEASTVDSETHGCPEIREARSGQIRANPPRSVFRVYGYLCGVFRHGLHWWRVDFARIAKALGLTCRTVETAVAFIRVHWKSKFHFQKLRIGRLWHLEIWDRKNGSPSPIPLSPWAFAKQKTMKKHAGAGFASKQRPERRIDAPPALLRLAGFVVRHQLRPCHWDNCKVTFRFAHAFGFAIRALLRGYDKRTVVLVYERALHKRHRDATDYQLNRGTDRPWEPSSVVTLATRLLADGRSDCARISERLTALLPEKRENAVLRAACRAALAASLS